MESSERVGQSPFRAKVTRDKDWNFYYTDEHGVRHELNGEGGGLAERERQEKNPKTPPEHGFPLFDPQMEFEEDEVVANNPKDTVEAETDAEVDPGPDETGRQHPRRDTTPKKRERAERKALAEAALKNEAHSNTESPEYLRLISETPAERAERLAKDKAAILSARENGIALYERIAEADELKFKISSDLVEEIGRRNPTIRRLLGGQSPEDLTTRLRMHLSNVAYNAQEYQRVRDSLTALTTFYDQDYLESEQTITEVCRENSLKSERFIAIMHDTKQVDKKLAIKKEIRRGYGFWKKAAYYFSGGGFYSGRRKSAEVHRQLATTYAESERKLTELTNKFVATLAIPVIEELQLPKTLLQQYQRGTGRRQRGTPRGQRHRRNSSPRRPWLNIAEFVNRGRRRRR